MTDLNELLERVKAATGPDRGLDARIEFTLSGVSFFESDIADLLQVIDEPTGYGKYQKIDSANIPSFTASIDAALALVERVLPNTLRRLSDWEDGTGAKANLVLSNGSHHWADGASIPLAILAALLQALTKERTNVQ